MSALQKGVSWVYGLIPVAIFAALLYVVSATSVASAADPSHIARKVRNGYVLMGSVEAVYSVSLLAALGQEGIPSVCSKPVDGRANVLVPEEAAEAAERVLSIHGRGWMFRSE
jgi:hypothetical protein